MSVTQTQNQQKKRLDWKGIRKRALIDTVLLFLASLVSLLFFQSSATGLRLPVVGIFINSLVGIQNEALDQLNRFVYQLPFFTPSTDFPSVALVYIDTDALKIMRPGGGYDLDRGQLATLLEAIERDAPSAVFVDLDLSWPNNRAPLGNPELSAGDLKLKNFLEQHAQNRPRYFLAGNKLFGQSLDVERFPGLCPTSINLIAEDSGIVRWVPGLGQDQRIDQGVERLYPAAQAMQAFYGDPLENPPRDCADLNSRVPKLDQVSQPNLNLYGGIGERIVFREIRYPFTAKSDAEQLWGTGFQPIPAANLLQVSAKGDRHIARGSIVLIGRTDPESGDIHNTPVGRLAGIEIHTNALLTLASYRHFAQPLGAFGVILLLLPIMFLFLVTSYSLADLIVNVKLPIHGYVETILVWVLLFVPAVMVLALFGYYLDYAGPKFVLELIRNAFRHFETKPHVKELSQSSGGKGVGG
jgi:CHASE2 domain-containing sensor protein